MNATKLNRRMLVTCVSLALMAAIAVVTGAQPGYKPTPSAAPPDLDPLAWLQGTWRGEVGGDHLEEYWSPPVGDSMIGMFRWIKGGKVWMYEMLAITVDGNDIVFRLRHFDNKMVGWEEDKSLHWKLTQGGAEELVFENPNQKAATRITYRRSSPGEVTVRIDGEKDGKPSTNEFRFRKS
jgi:hypothetical protein